MSESPCLQLSPSSSQPPTTSCTSPLPPPPLAMKKSALKSTKCSLLAARKASLQRKRRLGIDLGEAGLGPERIRGGPRPSRGLGAASMAANIFQNAENFVLGDVDIITAGGNVERHEHIHVHIHIVRAPRRRARDSAGDSDTFPEGGLPDHIRGGLRHLYSTRGGDARVDDRMPHAMIQIAPIFFFFDPSKVHRGH